MDGRSKILVFIASSSLLVLVLQNNNHESAPKKQKWMLLCVIGQTSNWHKKKNKEYNCLEKDGKNIFQWTCQIHYNWIL